MLSIVARGWLLLVAVAVCAPIAAADPTPADQAFERGRRLLEAGRYAEACAAFSESQRLDPQLGTEFNLAQCLEKTGKLASALTAYRDVASRDTNGARRTAAADQANALARRVPHLAIQIENPPPDLVVRIESDGRSTPIDPTKPAEVDLGSYRVIASASGYRC